MEIISGFYPANLFHVTTSMLQKLRCNDNTNMFIYPSVLGCLCDKC